MIGRREFVRTMSLAGATSMFASPARTANAEPPPETTTIKIVQNPGLCTSAQYVAEPLLRAEGFTDVRYVRKATAADTAPALVSGEVDLSMTFAANMIMHVDAGDPVVLVAGGHVGCQELFATSRVQTVRDLKGKTIVVALSGQLQQSLISIMLAHVGLDPRKDVNWVAHSRAEAIQLLASGKIDALLALPPETQELRAKKIGHVIVNTTTDRPWSQYFCCMVAGRRDFVRKNPVATKRALRAFLKATNLCALEPERSARFLADKGYPFDYALQTMKEIPYGQWRTYDPADTVRFYALRLHEAGLIKSSPQKILADGTDWRFFNELKKELKG